MTNLVQIEYGACSEYVRFNYDPDVEGKTVQFRLIYRGRLSAASQTDSRVPLKHVIRCSLHSQIKELWNRHPELKNRKQYEDNGWVESEASRYERCGKKFLPLLTEDRGLACALEILFLRRDAPGNVLGRGGDIDNRLKVLFDALRIPRDGSEIPSSWIPTEDEQPLYCLLDDDKLITTMNITTDQLLTPMEDGEAVNDVVLIINVRGIITDFERAPWGFIA